MSDTESGIYNRLKYRHKSIYRCYLCYPEKGREITFDIGKEWFQMDMHFIRYHQNEMSKEFREKYLKLDLEKTT